MFSGVMENVSGSYLTAIVIVGIALFVLVLILWMVRGRGANAFIRGGKNRQPRLAVIDAAAVDAKRRLVLVRRDNVEHLVMIGGPSDIVVESRIVRGEAETEPAPPPPVVNEPAAQSPARPASPAPASTAPAPATHTNEPVPEQRPQAARPAQRREPPPDPAPKHVARTGTAETTLPPSVSAARANGPASPPKRPSPRQTQPASSQPVTIPAPAAAGSQAASQSPAISPDVLAEREDMAVQRQAEDILDLARDRVLGPGNRQAAPAQSAQQADSSLEMDDFESVLNAEMASLPDELADFTVQTPQPEPQSPSRPQPNTMAPPQPAVSRPPAPEAGQPAAAGRPNLDDEMARLLSEISAKR